jgi:hypothetical protein
MGNGLDAKQAFAFAIDLEGQIAAVQLEDRQIIGRSLDAAKTRSMLRRHLFLLGLAFVLTATVAEARDLTDVLFWRFAREGIQHPAQSTDGFLNLGEQRPDGARLGKCG